MKAIEKLKAVLCDAEGNVCCAGGDGDRKVISDALEEAQAEFSHVVGLLDAEHKYLSELASDGDFDRDGGLSEAHAQVATFLHYRAHAIRRTPGYAVMQAIIDDVPSPGVLCEGEPVAVRDTDGGAVPSSEEAHPPDHGRRWDNLYARKL